MRRHLKLVSLLVFLSSCGGSEDSSPTRTLIQNPSGNSTPSEWTDSATNYVIARVSDCVFASGQCGGVYSLGRQPRSVEMRAKIRVTLDNEPWTSQSFPIPPNLGFHCRFQICSQSESICNSHVTEKDLSNVFWQSGPDVGIILNQPAHSEDFEITHHIPANSSLRVFCFYHWFLDDPTGTPLKIVGVGTKP